MLTERMNFIIIVTLITITVVVAIFGGLTLYVHYYRLKHWGEGLW